MSNLSQIVFGGLPGNSIAQLVTTSNLAAVTAPGFLNGLSDFAAYEGCTFVFVTYSGGAALFNVTFDANGVATLALTPAGLASFDVTVGQAALASAGSVTLVASSGTVQYKVRSLQLNSGGTNFSGGGGDRLGQVTDGTTVYSVVPAATMQSLVNAQWGVTDLPNPAAAAINTSTVAGASLKFKYSGGTTDYTAGSLVISGLVQRVA